MREHDDDLDDLDIGPLLKLLRGDRSLRDVQKLTGVHPSTLSQVERGSRHPGLNLLKTLATFYGVPVQDLMRRAGMIKGREGMEIEEASEVERAFRYVVDDPRFRFGTRLRGPLTLDGKRFIVEMYEKFTGRRLLE